MNKFLQYMHGRHTAFVVIFSVVGTVFQWLHRLDATYISFVTIMMGYVLGHSVKEDIYAKKGDTDHGS